MKMRARAKMLKKRPRVRWYSTEAELFAAVRKRLAEYRAGKCAAVEVDPKDL